MKPVSGDLVTTANLAVVVRPVPTSGALVKISGLAAEKGSTPGRRIVIEQARAEADAAEITCAGATRRAHAMNLLPLVKSIWSSRP